ncbi:MAG TPA: hypothetical protein GX534_08240 [Thermoanaerobacterales bacterium]|nr:hypothetical protein [Thermoanaerobacterales bacterium]
MEDVTWCIYDVIRWYVIQHEPIGGFGMKIFVVKLPKGIGKIVKSILSLFTHKD